MEILWTYALRNLSFDQKRSKGTLTYCNIQAGSIRLLLINFLLSRASNETKFKNWSYHNNPLLDFKSNMMC